MFKRKELAEVSNVKPIAAETKSSAQRKESSGQSSCADPQNNPNECRAERPQH